MENIDRQVYGMFAQRDIYLTRYYIKKVVKLIRKSKRPMTVSQLLQIFPKMKRNTDPTKGQFQTKEERQRWLASLRKRVVRINPKTKKSKEFESIVSAAQWLKIPTSQPNISTAIKTGKRAYGYLWEFA